ncbi:MAG: nitronate monooxygenase [Bacteroidales bacterium]|nr:nitronate monooxygenase [Bacteroidales bacterium]
MNRTTKITGLFNIRYPLVQGGMVWCSGWRLAAAVSNCGGLGLLGAGSMHPDTLQEHLQKLKAATSRPFGVNVPLFYPEIGAIMDIIAAAQTPVVFTSAGSPKTWTGWLHQRGIVVAHVVSSALFAVKCEQAGVDAVVAEGFEAGGHNGREETTTMALIPAVRRATALPLLAAGGIGSGRAMLAAIALGADGVQIGSRFAISQESSAHPAFKDMVIKSGEGATMLALKKLSPVRLLRNEFFAQVSAAEKQGASEPELATLLGKGRAKLGMFDGDLVNGELEIGQVAALFDDVPTVSDIMSAILSEYETARCEMNNLSL